MKYGFFIIIFIMLISLVYAEKFNVGEIREISGKNVTLLGVGRDSIRISVDEKGGILRLNETEIINGIRITVNEIFYFGDRDVDYADITADSIYVCGDNRCDNEERGSCCLDCGCEEGYQCEDSECKLIIIPECLEDIGCDDNNTLTEDKCKNKKCIHTSICTSNDQCRDDDECTRDYCEDGTCFNENLPGCGVEDNFSEEVMNETEEAVEEEIEDVVEEVKETVKEEKKGFFFKIFDFFKRLFK